MKNIASILVLSLLGLDPIRHKSAFAADAGQPKPASTDAASNIRGGMLLSPPLDLSAAHWKRVHV
jgi:hypothetical protein